MSASDFLNYLGVSSLGGLVGGLLSLVGKYFVDRATEEHKWKLRKKELLLDRELEAASAFFKFRRTTEQPNPGPGGDWDDYRGHVIENYC
jgi:hypothetical protein